MRRSFPAGGPRASPLERTWTTTRSIGSWPRRVDAHRFRRTRPSLGCRARSCPDRGSRPSSGRSPDRAPQRLRRQARRKIRLPGRAIVKAHRMRRCVEVTADERPHEPTANEVTPAIPLEPEPLHAVALIRREAFLQASRRLIRPIERCAPDMDLVVRHREGVGRRARAFALHSSFYVARGAAQADGRRPRAESINP